ncbi:DUF4282 domain-containing protein [Parvularcula oceani]|uniref:DUF4282 domain-containing protein n=1 Tax=Parvularcula oceani TaxID=1247963 RepID=UPI0004E0B46E|nr:DUF4282 domain-containing protein [Parvularcula oceani]
MSDAISRFLSFDRPLGQGLVKFAYFVLLAILTIATVIAMIAAFIGLFTGPFWANLFQFLILLPLQFLVGVLLLRVGTEVVLAILSIDDRLAPAAQAEPKRRFEDAPAQRAEAPRTTVSAPVAEEDRPGGSGTRSAASEANGDKGTPI